MPGSREEKLLYFQSCVKFFHEYRWIYDFKGTRILLDSVMQAVPLNFQEYFTGLDETSDRFHEILFLKDHDNWPSAIGKFVKNCIHLKNLSEELKKNKHTGTFTKSSSPKPAGGNVGSSKLRLPKKWNPKKYFEVIHVGNFVGEKCKLENCDAVIDIGSGLGYLSRHIASEFEIPVIGIESDSTRVRTATSEYLSGKPGVSSTPQTYVCLKITENISEEIGPYAEKYHDVCVTALHACGDLTPWSLKHFIETDSCKMVAVVPCCYHKMNLDTQNFPMSTSLKTAIRSCEHEEDISFLKNQWLWRLACQRSGDKFLDDIEKETQNMFFRAILERICENENLLLQKRKRKAHGSNYKTFGEYLEKTLGVNGGYDLHKQGSKISDSELAIVIQSMLRQHEKLISWSRIITGILAMQGAIQKIAEDMILIDRLVYVEEFDVVKESGLIKVIPDDVSPRGMVLFGIKK